MLFLFILARRRRRKLVFCASKTKFPLIFIDFPEISPKISLNFCQPLTISSTLFLKFKTKKRCTEVCAGSRDNVDLPDPTHLIFCGNPHPGGRRRHPVSVCLFTFQKMKKSIFFLLNTLVIFLSLFYAIRKF